MTITKQKKGEILKDLKETVKKAGIVLFVNFHGLNVSKVSELRRLLTEVGAKYQVAKKTLLGKAMEDSGFTGEAPALDGEVAMVTSSGEPTTAARVIHQFIKKNKVAKIIGGIFESGFMSADKAMVLATIPPREGLIGQFVNVINSPIQSLVVALSKIAEKKAVA